MKSEITQQCLKSECLLLLSINMLTNKGVKKTQLKKRSDGQILQFCGMELEVNKRQLLCGIMHVSRVLSPPLL